MEQRILEMRKISKLIEHMPEFSAEEKEKLDALIQHEERRLEHLKTNFVAASERRRAAEKTLDARAMVLNQVTDADDGVDMSKMFDLFRSEHERLLKEIDASETSS